MKFMGEKRRKLLIKINYETHEKEKKNKSFIVPLEVWSLYERWN